MSSRNSEGAVRPKAPERSTEVAFVARLTSIAVVAIAWGAHAQAQETTAARALIIEPSASVSELLTDNVRLTSDKSAEAITQLTAALRLISRSGRVQGSLDYALNGYVYARDTGASTAQNTLNARLRADVVDNWFTIDGRASVGQQSVSAFGVQSVDPLPGRGNLSEVRTYEVTPMIRGKTVGDLVYQASLSQGATKSDATAAQNDATSTSGTLTLGSGRASVFGWSSALSRRKVSYDTGRTTEADTARLALNYAPTSDWRLSANVGRESTNYRTRDKTANAMWGVGAEWSPSTSTRFSGQADHRFFGVGYQLSFEYRLPRSVIRLSSSRDVSDPFQQMATANLGTAYDLFYGQFASIESDPIKRDQLVRGYLQNYGIDPARVVTVGFLTNEATLARRNEISYALQGVRSNLVLSLMTTATSRLDRLAVGVSDFADSDVVRQRVYTLSLGHRLTPVTGINLELQDQSAKGSISAQSTTLRSLRLSLTTALGQRSTASLGARHVVFDSLSQPYTENAVIATFGLKF